VLPSYKAAAIRRSWYSLGQFRVAVSFAASGACSAAGKMGTGTELRFEAQVHPNVNAQQANGDCGSGRVTYILIRKPGQNVTEGESRRDGAPVPAQVTLAP